MPRFSLTLKEGTAEVRTVTVTNDAGYVPEGVTSFLARRPRAR